MDFRLSYLHLTLADYNGEGQGHIHFDCEYLQSSDIVQMLLFPSKVTHELSVNISRLDLGLFQRLTWPAEQCVASMTRCPVRYQRQGTTVDSAQLHGRTQSVDVQKSDHLWYHTMALYKSSSYTHGDPRIYIYIYIYIYI